MALFTQTTAGVSVTVRVTPRAGRTAIAGVREDVLLVKLAAAPVDGAANDALIALLSEVFELPKRNIAIVSGDQEPDQTRRACRSLNGSDGRATRGDPLESTWPARRHRTRRPVPNEPSPGAKKETSR